MEHKDKQLSKFINLMKFSFNPLAYVQERVAMIFDSLGETDIHGFKHAMDVLKNAKRIMRSIKHIKLHSDQIMAIYFACLMHDIDDKKINPTSKDYDNARMIMQEIDFGLSDEVIEMIHLVSFSQNGNRDVYILEDFNYATAPEKMVYNVNNKGTKTRIPEWKLIPRMADRIDALGYTGVVRCIVYGYQIQRPMYNEKTPRPRDRKEILNTGAKMWFSNEKMNFTTMDFFLKGVIPRLSIITSYSDLGPWLKKLERPIIDFILLFSEQGSMTEDQILDFLAPDPDAQNLFLEEVGKLKKKSTTPVQTQNVL